MQAAGKQFGLATICEVVSLEAIEAAVKYVDMLQIGARNMQNFILLKEAGRTGLPVLLKRGLCATIEEWLNAAEYIMAEGNPNVVLCERGIRTYETSTRNTLDLSAVPVLKEKTHLPIIVDPSHATGAYRYVPPMAKARHRLRGGRADDRGTQQSGLRPFRRPSVPEFREIFPPDRRACSLLGTGGQRMKRLNASGQFCVGAKDAPTWR